MTTSRRRWTTRGATRESQAITLTVVGLVVGLVLGACADSGQEATQDAGEGASQAASETAGQDAQAVGGEAGQETGQEASQAQAGTECWVRGDPAELPDRPSPFDSTEVALDAGTFKVCYSRPQMRGRTIFGDLVPFGEPWRLGANEATAIYVPAPAAIGEVDVESGWYTLYAIPGEQEWEIVVNSATERWGIGIDNEVRASDVGSTVVSVEPTDAPVEMLTMTLEQTSPAEATLFTEWEETRVSVPIRVR